MLFGFGITNGPLPPFPPPLLGLGADTTADVTDDDGADLLLELGLRVGSDLI